MKLKSSKNEQLSKKRAYFRNIARGYLVHRDLFSSIRVRCGMTTVWENDPVVFYHPPCLALQDAPMRLHCVLNDQRTFKFVFEQFRVCTLWVRTPKNKTVRVYLFWLLWSIVHVPVASKQLAQYGVVRFLCDLRLAARVERTEVPSHHLDHSLARCWHVYYPVK